MLKQAQRRYRKRLVAADVSEAFERLQYQPRALMALVLAYCTSDRGNLTQLLTEQRGELLAEGKYESMWRGLSPIQQLLRERIALGGQLSSRKAREYLARALRKGGALSLGSVSTGLFRL